METKVERLFYAVPIIYFVFIAFLSFTKAPEQIKAHKKQIVTGGGFIDSKTFIDFNVVVNNGKYTGHFQYGETSVEVTCVSILDSSAIIYGIDENDLPVSIMVTNVPKSKKRSDLISPLYYDSTDLTNAPSCSYAPTANLPLASGNIEVDTCRIENVNWMFKRIRIRKKPS
jgi:hypothetical protein